MTPAGPSAPASTAPVLEVFGSKQGEGPYVGDAQIFIRFGGCNLVCDYCDTPESIPAKSGVQRSLESVLAEVDSLLRHNTYRSVSLTGGEPLLQVKFLAELIPALRTRGLAIYLETNGTLPQALEKVVSGCDVIAMDFKPASAVGRDLWEAHRWFLSLSGSKAFVKLILSASTSKDELERAVALVDEVRRETPLVLQPATEVGTAGSIPLERLASWWAWAASRLPDVRVIPQTHRLLGIP